VHFRVLEFNSGARWQTAQAKPMLEYGQSWHWTDPTPTGITDLGAALDLLSDALEPNNLGPYNYPPVVILLSDGYPTDDWETALANFNNTPFGRKPGRTIRAALSVQDADKEVLTRFTGNSEYVVEAKNSEQVVKFLKWATITLSQQASKSRSINLAGDSPGGDSNAPSTAPVIVAPPSMDDDDDVF